MIAAGKGYDQIAVGDSFSDTVTITDAHIERMAELTGDFHPLHVDEEYAKTTRFGGRIAHGMLTAALIGGPVGKYFHGTGIAYLEHNCRFTEYFNPASTQSSSPRSPTNSSPLSQTA
jgi:3-hydroxybutyryl-CoA dehydratase